jgi:hypothetical protein
MNNEIFYIIGVASFFILMACFIGLLIHLLLEKCEEVLI